MKRDKGQEEHRDISTCPGDWEMQGAKGQGMPVTSKS